MAGVATAHVAQAALGDAIPGTKAAPVISTAERPAAPVRIRIAQVSLAGLWATKEMKVRIDHRPDGALVLHQVDTNDDTQMLDEIAGEARSQGNGEWVERHIWGGSKAAKKYWGRDGGLYVRLETPQRLYLQFRDSKFTGGWYLDRQ